MQSLQQQLPNTWVYPANALLILSPISWPPTRDLGHSFSYHIYWVITQSGPLHVHHAVEIISNWMQSPISLSPLSQGQWSSLTLLLFFKAKVNPSFVLTHYKDQNSVATLWLHLGQHSKWLPVIQCHPLLLGNTFRILTGSGRTCSSQLVLNFGRWNLRECHFQPECCGILLCCGSLGKDYFLVVPLRSVSPTPVV